MPSKTYKSKGWRKLRNIVIGSVFLFTFLASYLYLDNNQKISIPISRISRILATSRIGRISTSEINLVAPTSYQLHGKQRKSTINPPKLTEDEEKRINFLYSSSKNKQMVLDEVSKIVQNQIRSIQTDERQNICEGPNFVCKHSLHCGFGCQVHHWMGCLMISYSLSLPLIHNAETAWSYSKKPKELFEPIASNCTPGNNTYQWNWSRPSHALLLYRGSQIVDKIAYPLKTGLKVSQELKEIVERIHPNPFLWWVGQFQKVAMTPRPQLAASIERHKRSIGFSHPIVGFHVRRTDKLAESPGTHHEVDEYIKKAEAWFKTSQFSSHSDNLTGIDEGPNKQLRRKAFIASDDSQVLSNARKRFTDWNLTGFLSNETLAFQALRKNALDDIVRDLLILSECDYIVCGFSSNICTLLLEILSSKNIKGQEMLVSLDERSYIFYLQNHYIFPSTSKNTETVEPRPFKGWNSRLFHKNK